MKIYFLLFSFVFAVRSAEFDVYHALVPKSHSFDSATYTKRGIISINKKAEFKHEGAKLKDIKDFAFYLVKVVSKTGAEFTSYVPKCKLFSAEEDEFVISQNNDEIFNVDYYAKGSCSAPETALLSNITTAVRINEVIEGSKPKLEYKKAEAHATGEVEEKSFLQKYWLYIVLFVGMMLVNAVAPEPPQQQQQQKKK